MESDRSLGPQAYYESRLAEGQLEIQRCEECRSHVFYPRTSCPFCGCSSLSWTRPSGFGTVYSTTTVQLNPAKPYDVSLIDLDEGVRMMGRVIDVPAGSVAIGQRVKVKVDIKDGKGAVWFTAAEAVQ